MVKSIGIDIVAVDRIRHAMTNPRFSERILTPKERTRNITPAYLAGRWAAKEAASKCIPALGSWHDIEVLTAEDGSPQVSLAPGILGPDERLMVSITHDKGHAAAVAILVSGPEG